MKNNAGRIGGLSLVLTLALAACGGAAVEDLSNEDLASEVRGAPKCSVAPAAPTVGEDYVLSVSGMRRGSELRVLLSDASGVRESMLTADADGRASLTARSELPGAAGAVIETARRKGGFAEATRCSFEVVAPAVCGDSTCQANESCESCPADCGACPTCGDGACNGEESCSSCAQDCGACAPSCGDGACNGEESCSSCSRDCGACAPFCGDGSCNGTESCSSCAQDCGACAPSCGDGACNGTETCDSCALDCGACPPPPPSCEPAVSNVSSGRHNAGKACASCHGGGGAVRWTIAGTLYTDEAGSAPVSGATILVEDASGKTFKLVTASNGNFYTSDTSIRFPVKVAASKCPSTTAMASELGASDGDCNSCHSSGFRIHLP